MIRTATAGYVQLSGLPRRADSPAAFRLLQRSRLRGTISPTAVDALASAIQTQEGYYPGSLAYQNNNPGNLVFAGQAGATLGAGGFAKFSSYSAGRAALENQITLDAVRGTDVNGNPVTNVSQLISSWAPPSENNTAAYISSVSSQTGFDPNAPLSSLGTSDAFTLPDLSDYGGYSPAASSAATVDLSAVGLPADVPLVFAVAGGLGAAFLVSRLF